MFRAQYTRFLICYYSIVIQIVQYVFLQKCNLCKYWRFGVNTFAQIAQRSYVYRYFALHAVLGDVTGSLFLFRDVVWKIFNRAFSQTPDLRGLSRFAHVDMRCMSICIGYFDECRGFPPPSLPFREGFLCLGAWWVLFGCVGNEGLRRGRLTHRKRSPLPFREGFLCLGALGFIRVRGERGLAPGADSPTASGPPSLSGRVIRQFVLLLFYLSFYIHSQND